MNTIKFGAIWDRITYRIRANKGRSQLVAAPLTFQAKTHFLMSFLCGNLKPQNIISKDCVQPLLAQVRYSFHIKN